MSQEPSTQEEKWFFEQEQKRLAEARALAEQEKAVQDREARQKLHYMKCPKCGGDLATLDYEGVQIDRCGDCNGIWLDNGELEQLTAEQSTGLFGFLKRR